jgi:hypothetical protein
MLRLASDRIYLMVHFAGADPRDTSLENPCVGGSIPPRATKNIKNATFGWHFCY